MLSLSTMNYETPSYRLSYSEKNHFQKLQKIHPMIHVCIVYTTTSTRWLPCSDLDLLITLTFLSTCAGSGTTLYNISFIFRHYFDLLFMPNPITKSNIVACQNYYHGKIFGEIYQLIVWGTN